MAVHKYLDLSTAHLPVTERERLDDGERPGIIRPHPHGWWVWVPADVTEWLRGNDDEDYEAFPALLAAIHRAQRLGCNWINLDADGDHDDELPTYEEE